MSTTLFLILAAAILVTVTVIVILDGPKLKRRDDRDAAKSEALEANPARLYKSQQAAELQVGEEREVAQPRRFAPDANANAEYITK